MADKTGITWTNRTWNPWRGCTKITPGCTNCYMFTEQYRYKLDPTVVTRTGNDIWKKPKKWTKEAERDGKRLMVFTCSWSDWFHKDADQWRAEAWKIVKDNPLLIFQILTKRHERMAECLPPDWGSGYENVWLGVTVENNKYVHRADVLRSVPARIKFISAEPLLGPMPDLDLTGIHWLISGGESGPDYRPMDPAWAIELRDMCKRAGTAFFHKQGASFAAGQDPYLDGKKYEEFPDNVEYRNTLTPLPMLA